MSHEHLEKQMTLAQDQIDELIAKAEDADAVPLQDGLTIPEEIQRREDRLVTLGEAKKVIEARAKERLQKEQAEYQSKLVAREEKEKTTGRKTGGNKPQPPKNEGQGPTVYAAQKRQHHGRSVVDLEEKTDPPAPHQPGATIAETMAHRLETAAGKALYKLRKQTVEPVFGIIKEVLGFRRFSMRGKEKANIE